MEQQIDISQFSIRLIDAFVIKAWFLEGQNHQAWTILSQHQRRQTALATPALAFYEFAELLKQNSFSLEGIQSCVRAVLNINPRIITIRLNHIEDAIEHAYKQPGISFYDSIYSIYAVNSRWYDQLLTTDVGRYNRLRPLVNNIELV